MRGQPTAGVVEGSDGSYAVVGSHTYAVPTTYTIAVTVSDAGGAATFDGSADVQPPPVYDLADFSATPYNSYSASDFTATVDWGYGISPTPGTVSGGPSEFHVSAPHPYAEEGTYTAVVSLYYQGAVVATFGAAATVLAAPMQAAGAPQAPAAAPAAQVEQETFTTQGGQQELVASDDGTKTFDPVWDRAAASQSPLVFVSGTSMALQDLQFFAPPKLAAVAGLTAVGTVTGVGVPKGMTFTIDLTQRGPTELSGLIDELIPTSVPFNAVTEGLMSIHWEITAPNGQTTNAGTTANQLYVPLQAEYVGTQFGVKPLYQTVLQTGCVYNNGNADTEASVIKNAWVPFHNRQVPEAVTGAVLKYYGQFNTPNDTTGKLLGGGDGNCIAWAKFLVDVLEAQGIHQADWYYTVVATTNVKTQINMIPVTIGVPTDILVKKWNWTGQPTFVMPEIGAWGGYLKGTKMFLDTAPVASLLDRDPLDNPHSYNWNPGAQVVQAQNDPANFPGQGVQNPQSLFPNHNLVAIDGKLYDPSYGQVWADLKDFRSSALDGFAYDLGTVPIKNNQYDAANGTDQHAIVFYPQGTGQADITVSRATDKKLSVFDDY